MVGDWICVESSITYMCIALALESSIFPWAIFLPLAQQCIDQEYISDNILELLDEASKLRQEESLKILQALYNIQQKTDMELTPAFQFFHFVSRKSGIMEAEPQKLCPKTHEFPSIVRNNVRSAEPKVEDIEDSATWKKSTKSSRTQLTQGKKMQHQPPL